MDPFSISPSADMVDSRIHAGQGGISNKQRGNKRKKKEKKKGAHALHTPEWELAKRLPLPSNHATRPGCPTAPAK
jgi:hypothetical protein